MGAVLKHKNKALNGAKEKGKQAARDGLPRSSPYDDKRGYYHNMVTFSRAFTKWWLAGYDEIKAIQDQS
jgi:hypothetical protein